MTIYERAKTVLVQDGGGAWNRVAIALLQRRALSGDEVRGIKADEPEAEFFS